MVLQTVVSMSKIQSVSNSQQGYRSMQITLVLWSYMSKIQSVSNSQPDIW